MGRHGRIANFLAGKRKKPSVPPDEVTNGSDAAAMIYRLGSGPNRIFNAQIGTSSARSQHKRFDRKPSRRKFKSVPRALSTRPIAQIYQDCCAAKQQAACVNIGHDGLIKALPAESHR
jgi:hypothetical protein